MPGALFGTWYKVEDPAADHSRVERINDKQTYICTIAQRVEDRTIAAAPSGATTQLNGRGGGAGCIPWIRIHSLPR